MTLSPDVSVCRSKWYWLRFAKDYWVKCAAAIFFCTADSVSLSVWPRFLLQNIAVTSLMHTAFISAWDVCVSESIKLGWVLRVVFFWGQVPGDFTRMATSCQCSRSITSWHHHKLCLRVNLIWKYSLKYTTGSPSSVLVAVIRNFFFGEQLAATVSWMSWNRYQD